MTREEKEIALYCLKASSDYHSEVCEECVKYPNCDHTIQDDVTETIIKALEQEPCEDAVSRQSMLDAITEIDDNTNMDIYTNEVREIIRDLPSVTPTQKWIPVSERLPEDKTYVLATIKVPNRIARARSGWYNDGFFYNDNGDTWKATDKEVIAWMPLPKPYKEESEENGRENGL